MSSVVSADLSYIELARKKPKLPFVGVLDSFHTQEYRSTSKCRAEHPDKQFVLAQLCCTYRPGHSQ